jgi:DNA polymerase sigma
MTTLPPSPRRILKKRKKSSPSIGSSPTNSDDFFDLHYSQLDAQTELLLSLIQPSQASEQKRISVVNSIRDLLESQGLKLFLFGSLAFKTYLPDGDIDMSVFVDNTTQQQPWYAKVKSIFHQQNEGLVIRDIQFINAEVC